MLCSSSNSSYPLMPPLGASDPTSLYISKVGGFPILDLFPVLHWLCCGCEKQPPFDMACTDHSCELCISSWPCQLSWWKSSYFHLTWDIHCIGSKPIKSTTTTASTMPALLHPYFLLCRWGWSHVTWVLDVSIFFPSHHSILFQ